VNVRKSTSTTATVNAHRAPPTSVTASANASGASCGRL